MTADSYQTWFNNMPCFVTVLDKDRRVVESNRKFAEAFGEKRGVPCYAAYKGATKPCASCPVVETLASGKPVQAEEEHRDASGTVFPVAVYTSPSRDANGEIQQVLKISADISQVKKLQKKLHRTQQRFERLFNEVPCYVSVQDRELKVTACNRRFREDFGDELMAHCFEVYKHRDEPCLDCPVVKTFEDGRPHQSEEVVTALHGGRKNVLVQTQPLRDGQGRITHVVEMSTDITELRQLQDQLTSLGLLVGSISHNVKGLITAIDGGAYLVNSGFQRKDKKRIAEGWDIVQRNIARIRSMVLDILHYAKERELDIVPVDGHMFANEVCELFEVKADSLEIEFERHVDPGAGQVDLDVNALRSALVNILENSFDACRVDMDKTAHRVRFDFRRDGDDVVFTIQDNGIGMDRETREKMFTMFFSSKGPQGTGLGLFISNRIVRQHGGSIDVDSSPQVGTRFVIRIPAQNPAAAHPVSTEAAAAQS